MTPTDQDVERLAAGLSVGDWCTWRHVPRGGWGHLWPVDAVVKELRGSRAKIEVTLRVGERAERWVKIETLYRWPDQPGQAVAAKLKETER